MCNNDCTTLAARIKPKMGPPQKRTKIKTKKCQPEAQGKARSARYGPAKWYGQFLSLPNRSLRRVRLRFRLSFRPGGHKTET